MSQDQFVAEHQRFWGDFRLQLELLRTSTRQHESDSMLAFPEDYRRLCRHLALARDRGYSTQLVDELNAMAVDGHRYLYEHQRLNHNRFARWLIWDFPRAVRRESKLFWLSTLLFYGPLFLMAFLIHEQPRLINSVMSKDQQVAYEQMYGQELVRQPQDDLTMFSYYIQNNVGIALRTFGSGLLFGIGCMFILLLNGVAIGSTAGFLVQLGHGERFFSFVLAGHGAFELTAIVLAGAAGMRLGFTLLAPGNLRRREAVRKAAMEVMPIVYGFALMLVMAAFIEAFWSPRNLEPTIKYVVGGVLWVSVYAYLFLSGHGHAD